MRVDFIAEKGQEKKNLSVASRQLKNQIIQTKKAHKLLAEENLQSNHDVKQLRSLMPAKEKKIQSITKQVNQIATQVQTLENDTEELDKCKEVLVTELSNEADLMSQLKATIAQIKKNLNA